jgi:hypothetical protein
MRHYGRGSPSLCDVKLKREIGDILKLKVQEELSICSKHDTKSRLHLSATVEVSQEETNLFELSDTSAVYTL